MRAGRMMEWDGYDMTPLRRGEYRPAPLARPPAMVKTLTSRQTCVSALAGQYALRPFDVIWYWEQKDGPPDER